MKFFVDTANLKEVREAHDMGVLGGGPRTCPWPKPRTMGPPLVEGRVFAEVPPRGVVTGQVGRSASLLLPWTTKSCD